MKKKVVKNFVEKFFMNIYVIFLGLLVSESVNVGRNVRFNGNWTSSGGRDIASTRNRHYFIQTREDAEVYIYLESSDTLPYLYLLEEDKLLREEKPKTNICNMTIELKKFYVYRVVVATVNKGEHGQYLLYLHHWMDSEMFFVREVTEE